MEWFDKLRKEILPAVGFKNIIHQDGLESDDTMAIIVKSYDEPWIMATTDEDMYQCLDHCDIFKPSKEELYTADNLLKEYGVEPKDWVLVKQISGCKSDTIPGVVGVAEKTAAKFITGGLTRSGKKYKSITHEDGVAIRDRNKWLVELPLPGTQLPDLFENKFDFKAFLRVCNLYKFDSFLKKEELDKWRLFFEGYNERTPI